MIEFLPIILVIVILAIIPKFILYLKKRRIERTYKQKIKEEKANCDIYEKELEKDVNFHIKNDKIKKLIIEEKIRDIKEIAERTGCSLEECFLKIKYLEEKGKIPNIHLNTRAYTLIECSYADEELLKKYTPYLNNRKMEAHKQNEFRYEEILYLFKKGLIPEIDIDEENKTIIFLDLHNSNNDLVTVVCSNCGSINDINRGSKIRCKYCGSLIVSHKKKN